MELKINVENQIYTVIPDEARKGLFLILADEINFRWVQMIEYGHWIELNPATHEPLESGDDGRINQIGKMIERYFD